MSRNLVLLPFLFLSGIAHAQYAPPDPSGFEGLVVETYYVADQNDADDEDGGTGLAPGAVTYRVYADLKPGYKLISVGGFPNHDLTIASSTGLWNNDDRGEAWGWDLPAQHLNKNTVAIDSWLSMGAASTLHWGIPKSEDPDGSVVGGSNNDGGSNGVAGGLLVNNASAMGIPLTTADGLLLVDAPPSGVFVGTPPNMFETGGSNTYSNDNFAWAVLGGIAAPDTANKILLGQFTTNGTLTFCFNLWVRIPDSLVCNAPNCHEIMEFYSEIVPSDTLGGGFATENKFSHPTLCFDSSALEIDCLGIPGGSALPGTPCDDGNPDTNNDTYTEDCACLGEDCEGTPGGTALPGTPCDDGDPTTNNEVWTPNCECSAPTGLAEQAGSGTWLMVHPNPVLDDLMITIRSTGATKARLDLVDALGSTVRSLDLGDMAGERNVQLEMRDLAQGLYFVRLITDGKHTVQRVVKQ